MENMATAVKKLALANYYSTKPLYVGKAEQLLRTWFLDTATAMNPNLTYAQYIPGLNDGRGIGIIETNRLLQVPDAVALLEKYLPAEVVSGVKNWFRSYNNWLLNSPNGKAEQKELNNHGTWYDVQTATYALFYGDKALAAGIISNSAIPRITNQFATDGKQPLELARTRAWDYSNMNLLAWARLATIAQKLGIDLWHTQNDGCKGISNAIRFLLPFATGGQPWPYQEIGGFEYGNLRRVVHMARAQYPDLPLEAFDRKFPAADEYLLFLH